MNQVTVCIATYGNDSYWRPLREVAAKSAQSQSVPCDLVFSHSDSDARNCGPSRNIAAERRQLSGFSSWMPTTRSTETASRSSWRCRAMSEFPAISCQRVDGTWTEHKKLSGQFAWVIGSLFVDRTSIDSVDFDRAYGVRTPSSGFAARCRG